MVNLKKIGKKVGTAAKKGSVGGGKAAVIGGKVGVGVGKAMNIYSPGKGDQLITASRSVRAGGRVSRETGRGNTSGNRKRVSKVAKNLPTAGNVTAGNFRPQYTKNQPAPKRARRKK